MRQLIENPVYMSMDDMEETFKGKWILIVKCDLAGGNDPVGGVPIVVADTPYEGDMEFYEQFRTKEFSPRCDANFGRSVGLFFPSPPGDDEDFFPPESEDEVFEWSYS